MFTRHAIALAVLVAAASAAAQPAPSPAATATPPAAKPAAAPKPATKPVIAPAATAPVVAPAAPAPAVEKTALSVPLPRAKPKMPVWPPAPRVKPEAPVDVAAPSSAPPSTALVAPAAPVAAAAPPSGQEALAACGNACSEILFKTVDECLWVQSANPRPITFSAQIGGKPVALKLEGADPKKADAHAVALKGAAAKTDEAAYHTRLHDPFISVSDGIPAYRVRLGPANACVKSRNEIQAFTASFAG